jgi:molybdate transport system substrate-binding protein
VKRAGAAVATLVLVLAVGCAAKKRGSEGDILVFAASSLRESFTTIGANFERDHPYVIVRFNFGPSDGLASGISEGARADVFASASETTMDVVARSPGVTERHAFARNKLIVITPKDDARVTGFGDLVKPGLKLVIAATGVPAGKYARQALEKAGLQSALNNVVSNEIDVKGVVQKIVLGEADAGIVYVTDATAAAAAAKNVRTIVIPEPVNVIATYPIAVVKGTRHDLLARAFMAYVLEDGRDILIAAGFLPPAAS